MTPKLARSFVLLAALVALPACGAPAPAAPGATAPEFRQIELFGRSRADGPEVTDAEWQTFVDEVLTPALPDGFTVMDGAGQWRDAKGKIARERSKVVVVLAAANKYDPKAIERLSAAYKERFHQESVLRVVGVVDAQF